MGCERRSARCRAVRAARLLGRLPIAAQMAAARRSKSTVTIWRVHARHVVVRTGRLVR